jgi:WD40 repeat protein
VLTITFAPDGKTLASGGEDGTVALWNAVTGRRLRTLEMKDREEVRQVAFSPDGLVLVAASRETPVRIWHVDSGRQMRALQDAGRSEVVLSADLSRDGARVACALGDGSIRVWSALIDNEVCRVRHKTRLLLPRVAFAPDRKALAVIGEDGWVRIYDPENGRLLRRWRGPVGDPYALTYSPDGRTLAAAIDNEVYLWDAATGMERRRLAGDAATHEFRGLAFSPDGKVLAAANSHESVWLWDAATGKEVRRLRGRHRGILAVAFAPDGKTLATGGWDGLVRLWDVAQFKEKRPEPGHNAPVRAVAFAGAQVASVSSDGTLRLWDRATGAERVKAMTFAPNCKIGLAASADGRLLATAGHEAGHIGVWEAATGKLLHSLEADEGPDGPLAFSSDGRRLAAVTEVNGLALWDLARRKRLRQFDEARAGALYCVAFSPDGRLLATGDNRGELRLWDAETRRSVRSLQTSAGGYGAGVHGVAFSPDGRTVAAACEEEGVWLWEVATGAERGRLVTEEWAISVAFAPDGKSLACGGFGKLVYLWDLAGGRGPARLRGHLGNINSVTFAADGKALASASDDTTVLLWDTAAAFPAGARQPFVLSEREFWALWGALRGDDAESAYQGLWRLVRHSRQAVIFLRARLRPAPAADAAQRGLIERLIQELDSSRFVVRERAMRALEEIGEMALPQLRRARDLQSGLDQNRRLERLLYRLDGPTPTGERLRAVRAVEVLEHIRSAEARELLRTLADGAPEAQLTREARATLGRLSRAAERK